MPVASTLALGVNVAWMNMGTLRKSVPSVTVILEREQWKKVFPSQVYRNQEKRFNVSHPPLFLTIPFVNVVVDNLHLFLRVADVLIDHLIEELRHQDAIDKAKKISTFECSKYRHTTTTRSLYPHLEYQAITSSLDKPLSS